MRFFAVCGAGSGFFSTRFAAALAVALLLTGCDQLFQNHARRSLETAEKKYADGDYQDAVQYYEDALDGTAATAEVHYKLALLFDDKLKNPLAAVYHFQRYLDLKPSGPHVKEARNFIQEDQLKLVATLSHGALMSQEDAARLKNDNLLLRKQVAELRALPRAPVVRTVDGTAEADSKKPLPAGATRYEVQHGDTLASISRKFYKNSTRWKDIQDANYNALKGTVKLKPGMTLIIPK